MSLWRSFFVQREETVPVFQEYLAVPFLHFWIWHVVEYLQELRHLDSLDGRDVFVSAMNLFMSIQLSNDVSVC